MNSESLCNCPKNCQKMVRRMARTFCRIITAFTFDAGPNERIFTANTFIAAAFVSHLSYACSSGSSLMQLSLFSSCIPNSIFTCMVKYWPWELETWVEGKWRDILRVCAVSPIRVAKNFSICRAYMRTYGYTMWTIFLPIWVSTI